MTSLAQVNLRNGEYIVISFSMTEAGFWVANGMFSREREPACASELGEAVLKALSASETLVPTPPRRGPNPFDDILKAVNAPSFAAYMKGVRSAAVTATDGLFVVTPHRNGGKAEGFVELTGQAVSISNPSPAELGEAIQERLANAR